MNDLNEWLIRRAQSVANADDSECCQKAAFQLKWLKINYLTIQIMLNIETMSQHIGKFIDIKASK